MGALQQVVRPFFISSPQAKKTLSPIFIPNLQPTDLIQHTHAMKSTPRLSLWHLSSRFSVTMEPHCALKTRIHLLKNRSWLST